VSSAAAIERPPHASSRITRSCLDFLVQHIAEFSLQCDVSDTSCACACVATARVWLDAAAPDSDGSVAATYVVAYDHTFSCPVNPPPPTPFPFPPPPPLLQPPPFVLSSCRSSSFPSATRPRASRCPTRAACSSSPTARRRCHSACAAASACSPPLPPCSIFLLSPLCPRIFLPVTLSFQVHAAPLRDIRLHRRRAARRVVTQQQQQHPRRFCVMVQCLRRSRCLPAVCRAPPGRGIR
jgi:hypothetical protein